GRRARIRHTEPEGWGERVAGRVFAAVQRRGKFLLLHLDDGARLIVHLRMTGRLTVAPAGDPEGPHTHIVVALDGGLELRFSDQRTLGTWHYVAGDYGQEPPGRGRQGREAFGGDRLPAALA